MKFDKTKEVNGLLLAIATKDKKAVEKLYRLTKLGLLSVAKNYFSDASHAEDCLQTLFSGIYVLSCKYVSGMNGYNFMCKQLKYIVLTEKRKLKPNAPLEEAELLEDIHNIFADGNCTIEVREAIEKLPSELETVIYLRYYGRYTLKECAVIMNKSFVNIHRMQSQAEKLLSNLLNDENFYDLNA